MMQLEEKCMMARRRRSFVVRERTRTRILGSYVGRATDLGKRKERGNKALWTTKRRLKGSTFPKKLQARIVGSTMLFDCQTRPWRDREIKKLQRIADRVYTYIWRHKNGGPTKIQMERRATNLYGVRTPWNKIHTTKKIEKRGLETMAHINCTPNERITKQITLSGTLRRLAFRNQQTTIGYWRELVEKWALKPTT